MLKTSFARTTGGELDEKSRRQCSVIGATDANSLIYIFDDALFARNPVRGPAKPAFGAEARRRPSATASDKTAQAFKEHCRQ
jgi:hypothetical protein